MERRGTRTCGRRFVGVGAALGILHGELVRHDRDELKRAPRAIDIRDDDVESRGLRVGERVACCVRSRAKGGAPGRTGGRTSKAIAVGHLVQQDVLVVVRVITHRERQPKGSTNVVDGFIEEDLTRGEEEKPQNEGLANSDPTSRNQMYPELAWGESGRRLSSAPKGFVAAWIRTLDARVWVARGRIDEGHVGQGQGEEEDGEEESETSSPSVHEGGWAACAHELT